MPRVGFEPTTPVFERAKMVHVLDGAATVTGRFKTISISNKGHFTKYHMNFRPLIKFWINLVCEIYPQFYFLIFNFSNVTDYKAYFISAKNVIP
jgi:hypothetical protein